MFRKFRHRSQGFSLIELLVVLVVISVLLALTVVGLGKARDTANNTRCISNMKGVGSAILLYYTDYPNQPLSVFIPNTEDYLNHPQKGLMWHLFLNRRGYLPDMNALVCPGFAPYRWTTSTTMQTYGIRAGASGAAVMIPPRLVERPSHYVLLADSSKPKNWVGQNYYISQYSGGADTIHTRHRQRANLFFADGSIRGLGAQEIIQLNDGWNSRAIDEKVYTP